MGKRKGAGVFLSSPFPLQNLQTYNNSSFVQFPEFQIERQKKNPHPVPKFCLIPFPVKIFYVFQSPAPYFGQIPDPENTLSNPVL